MSKVYTKSEIANMLRQAGFPESEIPTMTAITMAESGGRSDAFNPRGPDLSYGLTQVNMIGDIGPERRRQFGLKSNEELYDPMTNLRVAKAIYDQQGLNAWGAYTNQSYKQFLPESSQAALDTAIDSPQTFNNVPQNNTTNTNLPDSMPSNQTEDKTKEKEKSFLAGYLDNLLASELNKLTRKNTRQQAGIIDPNSVLNPTLDPLLFAQATGMGSGYLNPMQYLQGYIG
jgi:hypothetical protein